jgi:hypothetical protein
MVYNIQSFWASGLCQSSGILNTRKQRFENWIYFLPQVRREDTYSVASLRKSLPQSLDSPCHVATAL